MLSIPATVLITATGCKAFGLFIRLCDFVETRTQEV